ncbi:MAG: LPS assembly lipoprotein LptE [SAR324 cluster bacterium]|nr:LPS assembly lipoprotein LptE [SAR324 cluster bacterium]
MPNDASSLSVLPIQNRTFKAGLETDLAEQLKGLLQSNSSVKLLPSGQADLKLSVTLLNLELPSSGLSKDQISTGTKAVLKGKAILKDRQTGNSVWEEKMIQVKIAESEGNQIENASSLTLSGNVRELINRFAQKLYDRIFTNF